MMDEKLQDFANNVAANWVSLPKDEIVHELIETIEGTRFSKTAKLDHIENDFGIYAFFIKPKVKFSDVEDLINVWNKKGFDKFPKVVKTRFKEQKCCNEGWYCFYLGKGENIRNRVNEHITHGATHATYGLKLKERKIFLDTNEIEVGYWHLPEMPDVPREIKQFIITNFESRLRDELKPWIGKQ